MPIITTRGGASARGFGFSGGGGSFVANLTIASDTSNYNIASAAITAGWDGTSDATVNLTINPAVYVYSNSPGAVALDVGSGFPGGSLINVTNNGTIVGRGGDGGTAVYPPNNANPAGNPGLPGSTGFNTTRPVTFTNNGIIAGGGGGGGGGGSWATVRGSNRGIGGGGGGGIGIASGGSPGGGSSTVSSVGGGGGPGGGPAGPGGPGGGYGSTGNTGSTGPVGNPGSPGGSAGTAVNGNSYVTFSGSGSIFGPTSG